MRVKRRWAAALLLLLPGVAWTQEEEGPAIESPEERPPASEPETDEPDALPPTRQWHYLTRLDATTWALLPRVGGGRDEGFVQIEPTLIIDGGPGFGVSVGAPVRLRLWGDGKGAGIVRWEDWDSLSDWGQLLRALKLGSDDAPLGVWLGALENYTLLSGHLVRKDNAPENMACRATSPSTC
jgi:hypothetical protein